MDTQTGPGWGKQNAERRHRLRAGVFWLADAPPDAALGQATSLVEAAGLDPTGLAVGDATPDAATSFALRSKAGPAATILRLWPDWKAETLLEAAATMDADLVVFADSSSPIAPGSLRDAARRIARGEAVGVAMPSHTPVTSIMPSVLQGLVLSIAAIRAILIELATSPGLSTEAAIGRLATLDSRHRRAQALASSRLARIMLRAADWMHGHLPPMQGRIGPAIAATFGVRAAIEPQAYLDANPDVRAARLDPHLHYLLYGRDEGRPLSVPPAQTVTPVRQPSSSRAVTSLEHENGPCRLIVLHGIGGGTRRYAELRAEAMRRAGITPILAWGFADRDCVLEGLPGRATRLNIPFGGQVAAAIAPLRELDIDRVEVLHTMGLDETIVPLLEALGRPYVAVFLDYHWIATQPHLLDESGGTAALGGPEDGLRDLLRPAPHPVLLGAQTLWGCSRDVAARVMRLVPALTVLTAPPPEEPVQEHVPVVTPAQIGAREPLRVLFIGDLVPHKGSDVLLDAARVAALRHDPVQFHQLGRLHHALTPSQQCPATLQIHGAFGQEDLPRLVSRIQPHIAWFPAMAPETYGFALSEAMCLGLPVIARGLGAYPERLQGRAHSWVVPSLADNRGAAWVDRFLRLRACGLSDRAELEISETLA